MAPQSVCLNQCFFSKRIGQERTFMCVLRRDASISYVALGEQALRLQDHATNAGGSFLISSRV